MKMEYQKNRKYCTLNNLRHGILLVTILLACMSCSTDRQTEAPGNDKIDSLLSVMTLDEKLGQLNLPSSGDIVTGQAQSSNIADKIRQGGVGGLFNIQSAEKIRDVQRIAVEETRLGIPLIFGMDVIHGYRTLFPIPIGISCSWDMDLVQRSARLAAEEASSDGICWTFSPMTDISREPRWGRVSEGNGEDPYLSSQIARAMVHGYQGDDLTAENTIMACVKHFALYGAPEAGRDYNTVDMSRIRMFNEYLPPYQAAVDAGVGSVMTSFNEIDGVPASANKWLLDDLLRDRWGFDGFVVTDYTAINEMTAHGIGDLQHVSALALKAGVDMDMVGEGFLSTLKQSLEEGAITEAQIDQACRRILQAKMDLGLFDDPYKYCNPERAERNIYTAEKRQEAREIAAETFVLLKNQGDILPLRKGGTIALVGPMADNRENMAGTWSVAGDFKSAVALREGIAQVAGEDVRILHARGANVVGDSLLESRVSIFGKPTYRDNRSPDVMIREAVNVARQADVIVAAMGESAEMTGESASRSSIDLPENQQALLDALLETGKPVVMVLFTGRPLSIQWAEDNIPAILNVWFPGSEAGLAIADVLFGDVNPSGKLSMTFPRNTGQIPIYYNHKNTGRPLEEGQWFQKFRSNYLDVPNTPLYPFGYGLSYTTFEYGNLALDKSTMRPGDEITVSVEVTNSGSVAGKEVVQLYIQDVVGSVTRPLKELKGFQKIMLEPGQTETVRFTITEEDLKFFNSELEKVAEPGEFRVYAGTNSADVLEAGFTLEKNGNE